MTAQSTSNKKLTFWSEISNNLVNKKKFQKTKNKFQIKNMLLPRKQWNNKSNKSNFLKKKFSKDSILVNKNIKFNGAKQIQDLNDN